VIFCRSHAFEHTISYIAAFVRNFFWTKTLRLSSGCNTLKKKIFENLYVLVFNVLSVSKHMLWYLNMSSYVTT